MFKKNFCSVNSIKWLISQGKSCLTITAAKAAAIMAMVIFTTPAAFAQGIDTGKIKQASQSIISAIQSICGIGIALLLVAGFGLFMWSGVSDTFRIRSLRIIGFSIMGGALLFLFAQPLADFLTGTFGATS